MVPSADKILRTVRPVSLPVRDGAVSLEGREDLQFVSVVNRYGNGKQVIGVFENFGLCEGAFATTITHDSHNLLVVYRDPESALKAVQALQACGGGIWCSQGQQSVCSGTSRGRLNVQSALPPDGRAD